MIRVGDHVRVLSSCTWRDVEARRTLPDYIRATIEEWPGPPPGTLGTVGLVVPKMHDDFWDAVFAIFDWRGRLAPQMPEGSWFGFDNGLDLEVVGRCRAPEACVCNSGDAPPSGPDCAPSVDLGAPEGAPGGGTARG